MLSRCSSREQWARLSGGGRRVADVDSEMTNVVEISLTGRPGRRFAPARERLLGPHLQSLARRLPGAQEGLLLGTEIAGARGVADLVAVTRGVGATRRRIGSQLGYLESLADCAVVSATAVNRTLSVASIARLAGQNPEQASRRLSVLARSGHVLRTGGGYRRHPALLSAGNAYALEAKVADWRSGVSQALRYASWCEAVAVVMLEQPRMWNEAVERCRALGVGLALQSKWAVKPRLGVPNPGFRLALSERFARAYSDTLSGCVGFQD